MKKMWTAGYKAKAYNSNMAHSAAVAALLYHWQSGHTAYIACAVWTLTCNQTAIRSPGLPFDGLNLRNPCNYMDYYSFTNPKGMDGLVGEAGGRWKRQHRTELTIKKCGLSPTYHPPRVTRLTSITPSIIIEQNNNLQRRLQLAWKHFLRGRTHQCRWCRQAIQRPCSDTPVITTPIRTEFLFICL